MVNQFKPHKLSTLQETFSIKPTCLILSVCCMKVSFTCWHKGFKHVSIIKKVFMVSLLESHNIKKGTSSTYLLHKKYFLHMTMYLKKHFLVIYHKRHIRIHSHSLCDQQSHIFHTLHHIISKISIL